MSKETRKTWERANVLVDAGMLGLVTEPTVQRAYQLAVKLESEVLKDLRKELSSSSHRTNSYELWLSALEIVFRAFSQQTVDGAAAIMAELELSIIDELEKKANNV